MKVFVLKKRQAVIGLCLSLILLVGGVSLACHRFFFSQAAETRLLPIYQVETAEPKIALTFDVAWESNDLGQILSVLEANNAKATFFVTGDWLSRSQQEAKTILLAGHDIQNHSDQHPHVASIGIEKLLKDTETCTQRITALKGKRPTYYRAPYGEYDNEMMAALDQYQVIQWNVDSRDWQENATVESICNNVMKSVGNGSILLFHVDAKPKQTAPALEKLLPELTKSYQCVLLSDLVLSDHYLIDSSGKQISE